MRLLPVPSLLLLLLASLVASPLLASAHFTSREAATHTGVLRRQGGGTGAPNNPGTVCENVCTPLYQKSDSCTLAADPYTIDPQLMIPINDCICTAEVTNGLVSCLSCQLPFSDTVENSVETLQSDLDLFVSSCRSAGFNVPDASVAAVSSLGGVTQPTVSATPISDDPEETANPSSRSLVPVDGESSFFAQTTMPSSTPAAVRPTTTATTTTTTRSLAALVSSDVTKTSSAASSVSVSASSLSPSSGASSMRRGAARLAVAMGAGAICWSCC